MYQELISCFTENTDYEVIDQETNSTEAEFSDLEERVFPLRDCWEFIGFSDGVYLASTQRNHSDELEKMGAEYSNLVNEMLEDQIIRRMNQLLGENCGKIYCLYNELKKVNSQIYEIEDEFKILIHPGDFELESHRQEDGSLALERYSGDWNVISIDNSEIEVDSIDNYKKTSIFSNKYKQGYSLGANIELPLNIKDLELFYHDNKFELPFSTEYVLMAAEENY